MGFLSEVLEIRRLARQAKIAELNAKIKSTVNLDDPRLKRILLNAGGYAEDELTQPYNQVPVVKAAIRAKATNIGQVPFRIAKLGSDTPLESGPMYTLFHDVNPYMTATQLYEAIVTNMDLGGDSPIVLDPVRVAGDVPAALWPRRWDQVQPAYRNGYFAGWKVDKGTGEPDIVLQEDMLMPKYYNPYDMLRGDAPAKVLSLALKAEWGAIKFNQMFFENDGQPGTVYSTDEELTDAQYARLEDALIKHRAGAVHAHKALLLDGGVKVSNDRPSNKDMEFLALRKFTREDVAMVFKVPKTELTLYEDVNYATALSQDVGFWKKTLIPLMNIIAEEFNTRFFNPRGYYGYFDIESIDALNSEILERATTAKTFWDMGVPFNQINDRLDLGFEEVDGGEMPWGGRGLLGMIDSPPEPQQDEKKSVTAELIGDTKPLQIGEDLAIKAVRQEKWRSLTRLVSPMTAKAAKAVNDYFFRVEQRILRKMVKRADGISVLKSPVDEEVFQYVAEQFSNKEIEAALEEPIQESADAGWNSLGAAAEVPAVSPEVTAAVQRRVTKVTGINDTAREKVIATLRATIAEGIEQGLTEEQRAQAIVEAVKDSMKMVRARAKTIARTETHGAFNEARYDVIQETGADKIMWLATVDDRVRDSHAAIDGQQIMSGDVFTNGLRYPHDPDGPPEEVINCRCVAIPIYEK